MKKESKCKICNGGGGGSGGGDGGGGDGEGSGNDDWKKGVDRMHAVWDICFIL